MKYVSQWWAWSKGGGIGRKLVGFGVPAFVALMIVAAIAGGGEEDPDAVAASASPAVVGAASTQQQAAPDPTATNVPPSPTPEPARPAGPAVIGTTQKVGDAEVTVHGFRESTGGQFLSPDPGMKWVIVDVGAKNVGDDPYNLSSLLQTAVRDAEGRNYSLTITTETTTNFDGSIPVQDIIRGEVAFEVPVNSVGLQFVFSQAFGSGQAGWALQ